jgi:hypothetical protein
MSKVTDRRAFMAKIAGVLSCFDRMLFRGYLPIMSGASMAQFLQSEQVNCENLKQFLVETGRRPIKALADNRKDAHRDREYRASTS